MMRQSLLGVCMFVALGVAVHAAGAAPQQRRVQSRPGSARRTGAALERRVLSARRGLHRTILADDFVATYDDGSSGDKAKELALASAFAELVESAVRGEFTVKEYGDTAIVRFTLRLAGIRQGQRAETVLRYGRVDHPRRTLAMRVESQHTGRGLAAAVLATTLLAACATAGPGKTAAGSGLLTLAPGQTSSVEGEPFRIRFESVRSDSRCPADVACIQAGEAVVGITVVDAGGSGRSYELRTTGATSVVYDGVTISLEGLDPRPVGSRPIRPADYRLALRVRR